MILKNNLLFLLMFAFVSCSSTGPEKNSEPGKTGYNKGDAETFIKIINEANNKAPESIKSEVYIEAVIQNKKYKSNGRFILDKKNSIINLTLHDYVFKSPLFTFIEDSNKLYFYYPVEKLLLVDTAAGVIMSDYTELNIDYGIIKALAYHQIPLLNNYKIYQVVNTKEKNENYLVIENDTLYETIFFYNKQPQKILFINKASKEKYEISLRKYTLSGNTAYYKNIKILSSQKKIQIDINVNSPVLNSKVNAKKFQTFKIPANVQKKYITR